MKNYKKSKISKNTAQNLRGLFFLKNRGNENKSKHKKKTQRF